LLCTSLSIRPLIFLAPIFSAYFFDAYFIDAYFFDAYFFDAYFFDAYFFDDSVRGTAARAKRSFTARPNPDMGMGAKAIDFTAIWSAWCITANKFAAASSISPLADRVKSGCTPSGGAPKPTKTSSACFSAAFSRTRACGA
jgi:hypothetical protein